MLCRCALALLLVPALYPATKRPLNQNDYDNWRHIQNQQLSNDGHFLAYAVFPQEGDGELIIRDLGTGKEERQPLGELPPPPPPNYSNPQAEEAPPPPPGIAVKFTPDSRFVVFTSFPARAAVEQAKREKRKPEDMPKGDIAIVNLTSGTIFRTARVKDFQLPTASSRFVAYLQLPEKPAAPKTESASAKTPKVEAGELVLRDLASGAERKFFAVTEYLLAKDASVLIYSKLLTDSAENGVYALKPSDAAPPAALLSGRGTYNKLAWDEDQTRLAFLSDRDGSAAKPYRFRLYTWDRHSTQAEELVSATTNGFKTGWILSDKAALTVSQGGNWIFFGTAPEPPKAELSNNSEDEIAKFDLWSWRDDYIQPMQKIRAMTERSRSYRAVYDVSARKFVQLADFAMNDVSPSDDGAYAIGNDDRAYRRIQEYDTNYADSYVVLTATGERKLIAPKHAGRISWSPDSKHSIYFDGKDWIVIDSPNARTVNLTAQLGVSFGNEQNDMPTRPGAYGLAGWTKDGRYALLYDRYDIWRCSPDGGPAVNLTQGFGRQNHLAFRIVRLEFDTPDSRWIDPAKPLLLRTESEDTHDSGFYRTRIDADAVLAKLVFAAKNFATPIKARDADLFVTAESNFDQFPDLLVTNATFNEFTRVSDANPQMADLLWGTSELIQYESTDGVPLKGILYKPANFDPHKKYPLLVYIYERLTQQVHTFTEPRPYDSINPSLYASNGYLVLEPDIAYKIGYPGESALECVLPAVQAVVDRGSVNEHAIGIQGHSWGGYQVSYMLTRTNRFRAAEAGAPVADMISAYDSIRWGPGIPRQFQYERTQSRIGGSVWEFPLRYIENSPIFMADRVTTPLLMIHNDADDAVPWYQGIEYYLALRRLNKEVYLFSYNGEPHHVRRRANQKDYALRLQQFFDYYLKDLPEPEWMEHGLPYADKPVPAGSADTDDGQP